MWQQLSKEEPAAVIQGYPGMGKSTLLARLTLYMARRGLHLTDTTMPDGKHLDPELVPIRLHLASYALQLQKTPNLTLPAYLTYPLLVLIIPHTLPFLR